MKDIGLFLIFGSLYEKSAKKILGSLLVLLLCSASFNYAVAEPTPSVRALMKEEVSLFSFGLYQLKQEIDQRKVSGLKGIASVSYDWDTNRIKMTFVELQRPGFCGKKDDSKCREICEQQYENIRSIVCWGEDCKIVNFFPSYFGHRGYNRDLIDKKSDAEVAKSLKDITEVEIRLRLSDDSSRALVCEGPITREKPSFRVETK